MQEIDWPTVLQDYVREDEPALELNPNDVVRAVRRKRWRVSYLIAAPIGLVALVAGVAAGVVRPSPESATVAQRPTAPVSVVATRDAAYVTASVQTAITNSTDLVLDARTTSAGRLDYERWVDRSTGRWRADRYLDGKPYTSSTGTPSASGVWTMFMLDYTRRTWSTMTYTDANSNDIPGTPFTDPAQIRDALSSGVLVKGDTAINGQDTIDLRFPPGPTGAPNVEELWVAADTFLPVRVRLDVHNGSPGETIDYTWAPRTPENLAHLNVAPPANFRKE
jgi:hypothetical protein